jgi:hypothetical protein
MNKSKLCHYSLYLVPIVLLILLNGYFSFSHGADSVVTLDRSGDRDPVICATTIDPVKQSYILTEVPDAIATLVMFTGGGLLGAEDGQISINATNFLMRSRHLFASLGFNVAVMDAATDFLTCPYGFRGQRLTPEHLSDIEVVIDDLRARYPNQEVWVVGICRGTLSAAQAAAELSVESSGPDGLVLLSTVTRLAPFPSNVTIFDVALQTITVPTLIATNKQDECWVTPPNDTKKIKDELTSVSKVHIKRFNGGFEPISSPCWSLSYHNYFGIEPKVVRNIAKWIKKQIN